VEGIPIRIRFGSRGKRQTSIVRGEHQGERAEQGDEQEEMLMLGMFQCGCELAA